MTFTQFAIKHKIVLFYNTLPRRTEPWANREWDSKAFHYWVTLSYGKNSYEAAYSKGPGNQGRKNSRGEWEVAPWDKLQKDIRDFAEGVDTIPMRRYKPIPPLMNEYLECLHSDCMSIENNPTFEDWAADMGCNPDSISDKECWERCVAEYHAMKKFLGGLFQEFLSCTDS